MKLDKAAAANRLDGCGVHRNDVILKAGWSDPPAMRYTDYLRPSGCFEPSATTEPARGAGEVHSVLYAFDSKVLPQVTDTILIAEQMRRRLMSRHKELVGEQSISFKFSGKSPEGEPLKRHEHAFYLPIDRDGDGRLDHVMVYCRSQFEALEVVSRPTAVSVAAGRKACATLHSCTVERSE